MTKPMVRIHNTQTDEIIDREMNDQEFAAYEAEQANALAQKAIADAEAEAKAQAKAQLLAQLGITEEQAKLLLS
jgi:hypothetical protein